MATGRNIILTKQVGEYLVSAELCRRGLIPTTFTGSIPDFDILAINEDLQTVGIQVKTIRGGSWQFDAKKFLKISISQDTQTVEGKADLANPNLICVFVRLMSHSRDEFYICTMREVQDIIYRNYTKWLSVKEGKRPKNPNSTHCSVYPYDLKNYKDSWETVRS